MSAPTIGDVQTYGPVRPSRSPAQVAWRVLVCVLVSAAAACAALVAAFVAAVEWSGCFIGCNGDPDPATGFALSLLAGALLAGGPLLTAQLFRSRAWVGVALAVGAAGTLASLVWATSG